MKSNSQIDPLAADDLSYKKRRLKGKSESYSPKADESSDESCSEEKEASMKDWARYLNDVKNSDSFEVGDYPDLDRRGLVGYPRVHRIYDSSHTDANLEDDLLLYLSKLAICFYNIREDTCFHDVKLVMATRSGITYQNHHITFEAFSSTSTGERVAVTFQTKMVVHHPIPFPRFEIMFVRIKPSNHVHNESENSQQDQPSEYDHKGQIYQQRLSQVIETYTIDSQLDSRYSLALYLSQYALVCYNLFTLSGLVVARHDIELLKVVELMKPVAEDPTYHITFKAPLRAKSMRKKFYTFKAEICMPILFPTTIIQLKSDPEVITG